MPPHINYLLLSIALWITFPVSANAGQSEPPKAARFTSVSIASTQELAKYVSPSAKEAIRELIAKRKCPESEMKVFRNPTPRSSAAVVTVACDPPIGTNSVGGRYFEYPLTIFIMGDTASEVDLQGYGFMYDSGRLEFISDIDKNDMPEFWLFGAVCECDGEPEDYGPKGCDCDGMAVVEFRNGRVYPWKVRKRGKGP